MIDHGLAMRKYLLVSAIVPVPGMNQISHSRGTTKLKVPRVLKLKPSCLFDLSASWVSIETHAWSYSGDVLAQDTQPASHCHFSLHKNWQHTLAKWTGRILWKCDFKLFHGFFGSLQAGNTLQVLVRIEWVLGGGKCVVLKQDSDFVASWIELPQNLAFSLFEQPSHQMELRVTHRNYTTIITPESGPIMPHQTLRRMHHGVALKHPRS